MSDLRVPKTKVEIELSLPGARTRRVAVFLAEFAPGHRGAESLADLLDGESDFIPAMDADTGHTTILQRGAIGVARVREDAEHHLTPDEQAERVDVAISLVEGELLRGQLRYVMPPDRSRPMDFLNDPSRRFFAVWVDGQICLVNKRQVVHVELVS